MKNKYEIRGDVTAIFIAHKGNEYETIIDTEDLQILIDLNRSWYICPSSSGKLYVRTNNTISYKRYSVLHLHRIICNAPSGLEVDHINGEPLDNRKSNLRLVEHYQNMQNIQKSGHKNVKWSKRNNKFFVEIRSKEKVVFKRFYDSEEEARTAAVAARLKFREFTVENEVVGEEVLNPLRKLANLNNKTSGHRNIYFHKPSSTWKVGFQINKKQKSYGYFKELSKAVQRADEVRDDLRSKGII